MTQTLGSPANVPNKLKLKFTLATHEPPPKREQKKKGGKGDTGAGRQRHRVIAVEEGGGQH